MVRLYREGGIRGVSEPIGERGKWWGGNSGGKVALERAVIVAK